MRRDECLARHLAQRLEHPRIEHVPGAYLLLDHLFAGLDRGHRDGRSDWTYCIPGGEAREVTGFRGSCQAALRRDMVKRRRRAGQLRYASGVRNPGTRIMKAIPDCLAAATSMTLQPSARLCTHGRTMMSAIALLCILLALAAAVLLVAATPRSGASCRTSGGCRSSCSASPSAARSPAGWKRRAPSRSCRSLTTAINHLLTRAAAERDGGRVTPKLFAELGERIHEAVLVHREVILYANRQFAALVGADRADLRRAPTGRPGGARVCRARARELPSAPGRRAGGGALRGRGPRARGAGDAGSRSARRASIMTAAAHCS